MALTCSFVTTCGFELLKGRNPATPSGATGAGDCDCDAVIACLSKRDTTYPTDTGSRWASSLAALSTSSSISSVVRMML